MTPERSPAGNRRLRDLLTAELARLDAQLSQIVARRDGLRRMLGATTPAPNHGLFRVK